MLKGKVALVTGGARGIGKCIVKELAAQGAVLAINYNKSEELAKELKAELAAQGVEVEIFQCDVRYNDKVKEMIDAVVEKFGKLDILVNNAGVALDARIHKMPEQYFDDTMAINVKGVWNTMQHTAPLMMEQGSGSIINISSVAGTRGNIGQSAYSSSKAAVIGMTKTVARETSPKGVRVNAVAPGKPGNQYINNTTNITVNERSNEFTLSWTRPSEGTHGIAGYRVFCSRGAGWQKIGETTNTYFDTNISNLQGTVYGGTMPRGHSIGFYIQAYNGTYDSGYVPGMYDYNKLTLNNMSFNSISTSEVSFYSARIHWASNLNVKTVQYSFLNHSN